MEDQVNYLSLFIITASLALQLISIFVAVRLMRYVGKRTPALLLLLAAFLMAIRRSFSLFRVVTGGDVDLFGEIIGFMVSFVLLACFLYFSRIIAKLHQEMNRRTEAEKNLRDTTAKLQALIYAIPDIVVFKDFQGKHLIVNKAAEEFIGLRQDELAGRTNEDLLPADIAASCKKSDEEAMRSPRPVRSEEQGTGKNGCSVFLDTIKVPIHDEKGILHGLVSVSREITDRKRTEDKIIQLARQKELILNAAGEGIYGLDLSGNITFINPAAAQMLGWPVPELLGRCSHDLFHHSRADGSAYPREECPLHDALMTGAVQHVKDEVFWRKDGTSFPVEYVSTPIREDSWITGAVVVFKDISERKQIEEELKTAMIRAREEKAKSDSIIAAIGDAINIQDTNYRILYQNDVSLRFLGCHVGEYCYKAFQNRDQVCERCHLTMAFSDGGVHTLEQKRTTDSGVSYVEITGSPLRDGEGKIIAGIELVREITDRKRDEETIKKAMLQAYEEKARSEAIISAIADELVILDPEFRIMYQNKYSSDNVGDHVGEKCYKAVGNETGICEDCLAALSFKDGLTHRGEKISSSGNGTQHLDITASPLRDESGKIIAVVEMVRDMTDRKAAEQALRISEERLSKAQKMAHVGNWEKNYLTGHLYWSEEVYRIYGVDPSRFIPSSQAFRDAMHPDDRETYRKTLQAAINERKKLEMDFRVVRPDGEVRTVHTIGEVSYDSSGRRVLNSGTVQDITEQKAVEEALRKSHEQLEHLNRHLAERVREETEKNRAKDQQLQLRSRQAAMGEMIDNIAHQWRQPLNNLGLIVQGMQKRFSDGSLTTERMQEQAKIGMSLIRYMSQTINDFTNFFRDDKTIAHFKVKDVVATALSFMETSLKRNAITVKADISEDIRIKGYRNEYTQVVVNILNNARDIFVERGVRTRVITMSAFKENRASVLTIADNGGGIPDELMDRIFLPYFTTKRQNKGTGIGLYMSQMIIENNMNGKLSVHNNGEGAEFRIEVQDHD